MDSAQDATTPKEPGIYEGLTNAEYHAGPGVSKSGLDLVDKNPATYRYVKDTPEERTETPDMRIGSALHAAVLEPELFVTEYCRGLRRQDAPEAVDDREELVAMVEKLNQERIDAHPHAIRGTDELVAKIHELNKTRKPKLPVSGKAGDLMNRIVEEIHGGDGEAATELEGMKAGDLKAIIQAENEKRDGLLSPGGDRKTLAKRLSENGVEVELWSDICEAFEAEHGVTYTLGTSASRHDMAAWLNANGVKVTLWSDVVDEWAANNGHRTILSDAEYTLVIAMRDAVMAHPAAARIMRMKGKAEQSVYWRDPVTGELCRIRPDWWVPTRGLMADVKTTDDASKEGFARSISKWRYHVQHPFYLDGANEAIRQAGLTLPEQRYFVFIAVEKKPPFNVGVYVLGDESIQVGRDEYRDNLNTYAECLASGDWPGYSDSIETISLNDWYMRRIRERLEAGQLEA
ncbi:PD-(D/E)XK nuclease-like domain-containing protein [Vreelandella alkaliphila]|uniref:PD-(D/E)XK nuclease-like domain-containing protein n=1 Tax=Vreelandella alkaliphila TaxID=272774 RepID=A0AAJ2RX71_9GAMM|nr:PD-(D/E)XK nuclease-like domain-containing protein [Halomonas alkaliphila]MDX5979577.1 PD-(D/E)XK nuclease-like domain-containing protein [Halomonas alkaliphila]